MAGPPFLKSAAKVLLLEEVCKKKKEKGRKSSTFFPFWHFRDAYSSVSLRKMPNFSSLAGMPHLLIVVR